MASVGLTESSIFSELLFTIDGTNGALSKMGAMMVESSK
jgi:hypothetical protein